MALRVDLYAVDPTLDLETVDVARLSAGGADRMTWLGFVSASDADEGALVDLLIARR